jgi:hypothetical protein
VALNATTSEVWAHADAVSVKSAAQQANARALVVQSLVSDAHSQAVLGTSAARQANSRALLLQSLASDAHSQAVRTYSAVGDITVELAASDLQYIASVVASQLEEAGVGGATPSQVWGYSDAVAGLAATVIAASAAQQGASRALIVQSLASDAHSQAARTYSAVQLVKSLASDAHSAAAQACSRCLLVASLASDAHSQAARAYSAAQLIKSMASDTHSQAARTYSAAQLIRSMASDVHSLALQARSAARAAPTTAAIADKVLGRNLAGGSDGGRTVTEALRPLRNKTAASTVLRVYEEDDSTVSWSAALTTDAAAEPVTGVDPT